MCASRMATTYEPVGRDAADANAKYQTIAKKLKAKTQSMNAGLVVIDPEKEKKKRLRLEDAFDDYIQDAFGAVLKPPNRPS